MSTDNPLQKGRHSFHSHLETNPNLSSANAHRKEGKGQEKINILKLLKATFMYSDDGKADIKKFSN
jgi:hypothetical protein